jgi:energy-coupling factor transport system ATP-binding protein
MELIKGLNESGVTIIMISHNMDGLSDFASRIIAMENGEVAMDGTPKEVFSDMERLASMGLGASEARRAAYLLAQRGWDIPDDIITVDELVGFITGYIGGGENGGA